MEFRHNLHRSLTPTDIYPGYGNPGCYTDSVTPPLITRQASACSSPVRGLLQILSTNLKHRASACTASVTSCLISCRRNGTAPICRSCRRAAARLCPPGKPSGCWRSIGRVGTSCRPPTSYRGSVRANGPPRLMLCSVDARGRRYAGLLHSRVPYTSQIWCITVFVKADEQEQQMEPSKCRNMSQPQCRAAARSFLSSCMLKQSCQYARRPVHDDHCRPGHHLVAARRQLQPGVRDEHRRVL